MALNFMNKELYGQAERKIEKEAEREKKEEIREEYQRLLYLSQMERVDRAALNKIKKIYAKAKKVPAQSQGGAYIMHAVKGRLEDFIEKKMFHPVTLRKIERYLETKEWDYEMLEEKAG